MEYTFLCVQFFSNIHLFLTPKLWVNFVSLAAAAHYWEGELHVISVSQVLTQLAM